MTLVNWDEFGSEAEADDCDVWWSGHVWQKVMAICFDRKPLYPPMVRKFLQELDLVRPIKGPVMVGGWSHIGGGIVVDLNKPRPGSPKGSLDELVLSEETAAKYRHLLEDDGAWATRPDVWIEFDRRGLKSGTLGIGYGGDRKRGIGPELAFGHVLGDHVEEQVCLIKTALGTPSLVADLRPPGSGQTGKSYAMLIQKIEESLANLQDKFPDFSEQSRYEIGGIVLNIGEEDTDAGTYAKYLERLIKDLRAEFHNDRFPVVIVGSGRGAEGNGFAHDHRSSKESGHVAGVSGNCDLCRNTGFLAG